MLWWRNRRRNQPVIQSPFCGRGRVESYSRGDPLFHLFYCIIPRVVLCVIYTMMRPFTLVTSQEPSLPMPEFSHATNLISPKPNPSPIHDTKESPRAATRSQISWNGIYLFKINSVNQQTHAIETYKNVNKCDDKHAHPSLQTTKGTYSRASSLSLSPSHEMNCWKIRLELLMDSWMTIRYIHSQGNMCQCPWT